MAVKQWIGAAQAVSQVTRVTYSAYTIGVTYTLTINNKSVSYTAVAATSTDVWEGLEAAWNASTIAEHVEAIATVDAGVLLTSRTEGTPFTVTGSATGGVTATVAAVTAATGPNSFTNAANWLGGVAPVATDDLLFKNSAVSVLYNLEDVVNNYGDITVEASYTGSIGLPETNTEGSYPEYRPRYLKLGDGTGSFAVTIGQGSGRFPERVMIDANSATIQLGVYGSGSALADAKPIQIKGADATSTAEVYGGEVGIPTGSYATFSMIERQDISIAPVVEISSGVTITTAVTSGGELHNYGTITTLTADEGTQVFNYGAIATAFSANRSVIFWVSPSNLTTKGTVYPGGTIDFSRHGAAKTVAALDLHPGGTLRDPLGVVTWTAGVALIGGKISDVTVDLGRAITLNV